LSSGEPQGTSEPGPRVFATIGDLTANAQSQDQARFPGARQKNHPDDVRFYLASGVLIVIGLLLIGEVGYAMFSGCSNLQATLDAFGLFDVAPMTLAGAISAFYFSERGQGR
jgi:hypothetical protein